MTNLTIENTKIIHIGVGAFHRAHQAYYFDKLIGLGYENYHITGVNLRSSGSAIIEQLQERDNNYVLTTLSPVGEKSHQEIKSIKNTVDFSKADNKDLALDLCSAKNIELITITVTESGYSIDENFNFDKNATEIQGELKTDEITTIYGFLRASLNRRKNSINKPITILCCDNLINNGEVLEKCFTQYLELFADKDLLNWVQENVSFPCCVVDRITPQLDEKNSIAVEKELGIKNDSTVLAENFIQWVIEDNFITPKPPLEKVGVQFTDNIVGYEEMKIRLLNAGHSSICYFGALKGYEYFDETIKNNELKDFYFEVQNLETIPSLKGNLPMDAYDYQKIIVERFNNEYIRDKVARICLDGSNKMQIFILPTIIKCLEAGIIPEKNISIIASWYVFMRRFADGKIPFDYFDAKWQQLQPFVAKGFEAEFAKLNFLWGDLADKYPVFSELLQKNILIIEEKYHG
jgi:D-arabinitol 4-dehydrogenase